MSLAALIKNRKAEVAKPETLSLASRIDEYLMLRPGDDRRDGHFHPSDLSYNFCPREWALYNYGADGLIVKEGGFPPKIKRVFDNGHGLHARMQRYFQMQDLLWGRYKRPTGYREGVPEYEWHFGFPPKLQSGKIDPTWEYAEVKLRNFDRNVLGSTDGVLRIKGHSAHGFEYGKWVLELKSINSRGFSWLPESHTAGGEKDFHRSQGLIYLDCLEYERRLGTEGWWAGSEGFDFWMQPVEGVIFLYEDKDCQEMKEFILPYSEEAVEQFFATVEGRMQEALVYKNGTGERRWPRCHCEGGKKTSLCKKHPLG